MEETEDETEGKIYCVLGWKELILLKCPYYPGQATDSVQSLSNCQWCFSQKTNNYEICLEPHKTSYSESNTEKDEYWRYQT